MCVDASFSNEQNAGHCSSSAVQHEIGSLGFMWNQFTAKMTIYVDFWSLDKSGKLFMKINSLIGML